MIALQQSTSGEQKLLRKASRRGRKNAIIINKHSRRTGTLRIRSAQTTSSMSASSPDERSFARMIDGAAIALLGVLALIAALTFRDYGLGWDDYAHSEYGDLLLSLYTSGFKDLRAFSFVNLYMYGGGFDMAAALLAKILPFDLFDTRRLAGAAVGLVGFLITWRIGRRIGGPFAGF